MFILEQCFLWFFPWPSESPPSTPQVALLAKVTEARTPENLVELVQEHLGSLGPWKNCWEFRKFTIFPIKNGGITMDDLAKNADL